MYTAKEDLYVNADKTKVVPENSAEAAWVLVGKGGQLDDETAKKYGLIKDSKTESKAVESSDVENKAVTNKATKKK